MEIPRNIQQSNQNFIGLGWTGLRQKVLGTCHLMLIWLANISIGIWLESDRNRWVNVKTSLFARHFSDILHSIPFFLYFHIIDTIHIVLLKLSKENHFMCVSYPLHPNPK